MKGVCLKLSSHPSTCLNGWYEVAKCMHRATLPVSGWAPPGDVECVSVSVHEFACALTCMSATKAYLCVCAYVCITEASCFGPLPSSAPDDRMINRKLTPPAVLTGSHCEEGSFIVFPACIKAHNSERPSSNVGHGPQRYRDSDTITTRAKVTDESNFPRILIGNL